MNQSISDIDITINPKDNRWQSASGMVPVPLTNDYLFCAMLQKNKFVLKSLICSLLHLSTEEIKSVEITNPIELGDSLKEKTFILDIKVIMNSDTIVNLEMQVVNQHDWPERSLVYLSRSFSKQLEKGSHYFSLKTAIHISILDFTLFPEYPEFFSTNYVMNQKTHKIYSDKFRLYVLCLTQINMATEEDKFYQIDTWARLFKCQDWRELQMLAKTNQDIQEAVSTIYQLTQDEKIRYQCERRAEAIRREESERYEKDVILRQYQEATSENGKLTIANRKLASENEQLASENSQLTSENSQLTSENERLRKLLVEYHINI